MMTEWKRHPHKENHQKPPERQDTTYWKMNCCGRKGTVTKRTRVKRKKRKKKRSRIAFSSVGFFLLVLSTCGGLHYCVG